MGGGMFDLQGKRALITGGAGGIGAAIARAFAQAGAGVCVADCAGADRVAADLGGTAIKVDLSSRAAAEDMVQRAGKVLGGLDIFVYAAGVEGPTGPLKDIDEAAYMRSFDINLHAATWACAAALPMMQNGGAIVLIGSIAGLRGNGAIGAYGMTKAALAQLARNIAVSHGPRGIRANVIAPGLIETPFAAGLMAQPEFMARRLAATPLRRVGTPQEIAATAQWLAAPAGGFVTGQVIVVDGGTLISDGS